MFDHIFKELTNRFIAFRADEDGAVTADFVVLTSSMMILGMAHVVDVAKATKAYGDDIAGCIEEDVGAILDGPPDEIMARLEAAGAACSAR